MSPTDDGEERPGMAGDGRRRSRAGKGSPPANQGNRNAGEESGEAEDEERPSRRRFQDTLSGKAARKLEARREGDRGIWFGLGMMGLVGWAVAIPTVAGIGAGIWLDRSTGGSDGVSWTLTGLVVGVILGCLNAWFWIQRELEER